jgi:drug/metabolite transporter (DMT)-like permease
MARASRWAIAAAFAAVYLIWGSTYLAIAVAVDSIPPVFMVAVRGLLAGAVLYVWARARGAAGITAREMVEMLPTAALLFGGGYVLVGWAEQFVASGPAALLNSTTPAFVVLFEWLGGRRSRPGVRILLALGLGVFGVSLLVLGGKGGAAGPNLAAALALLGASAAWAMGTVRARNHAGSHPLRTAALQLLTGSALLFPVSLLLGEFAVIGGGDVTSGSLLALAYLTVFGSLIGYSAYVFLLHQVSATQVASHSYVNPLIAVMVGALVAKEPLSGGIILAAISIVLAVVFIVSEGKSDNREPEANYSAIAREGSEEQASRTSRIRPEVIQANPRSGGTSHSTGRIAAIGAARFAELRRVDPARGSQGGDRRAAG